MGRSRLVKALIVFSMPLMLSASGCLKLRAPSTPPPPRYMETKDTFELLDVPTTTQPSATFALDGKPYCFGGANIYYVTYKSRRMVDDVLDRAKEMHLDVIRIWGYINIGSLDGSVRALDNEWDKLGTKDGVYFQYWDPVTKRPMVNEGENGLPRLDYVLHAARERGLKVIITFLNNWVEFGGIDQYIIWYGLKYHHQFFTDENVRQAYRDWVKALILRENTIDEIVYRDDPAIFSWELVNEPRCLTGGEFDGLEGWDTTTIVKWVDEMSRYVKELDPNHMVAVGDEGFLDSPKNHWTYNGHQGSDHEAMSAVENIDYATFHFYPDEWGTGYKFGYEWIEDHIEVARRIGKPTVMGEYGVMVRRDEKTFEVTWGWEKRKVAYTNWLNILREEGGNGMLVWMLGGVDDANNGTVPDYDHYTIYKDEPSSALIKDQAILFETDSPACKLSGELMAGATPSPFVSAIRLKK